MWVLTLALGCSEYALDRKVKPPEREEPDIAVSPSLVRFDATPPFCVVEQVVTVQNIGEAPLQVDGSWIEGDASLTAEWLADVIDPGAAVPVRVRFQPTEDGGATGALVVSSDDPDEPQAGADVQGVGQTYEERVDTFVQDTRPVDVLWVIDNSGSMSQEQARVIADIQEFYSWFETLGLDYHMGVITSDVVTSTMAGRLQGSPAYITPDTPDGLTEFAEALNVGTEDQGDESGLAAMQLALSEPVASAENAGFLRPDAQLVVTFLSDEPEQSGVPAADYITFLQRLKADPGWVLVSAIVGDRDVGCTAECDGVPSDAQAGNAYLDVVDAFGGVFGSICTCDLSSMLADMGLESTLYARSFTLTSVPATSDDIHVYVDGVETLAWTWDAEDNAVVFEEPPHEGQRVEVLYTVPLACESDPATDGGSDTATSDTATSDTGT